MGDDDKSCILEPGLFRHCFLDWNKVSYVVARLI